MTALDLITSSLRLLNVLAAGETLDVGAANDALEVFNSMLDAWNADSLAIFTTRSDDFPFVLGQQSYTIGTGGDFDIPRPPQIDSMSAILLTDPSNPVEVPLVSYSVEQWQQGIPVKNVDSSFPQIYYDDGGFPLRRIFFWPIPTTQPNSVRIYSWQALAAAATLQSDISFPPGYKEAFRFNLAGRLAPEYNVAVPPAVATIAIQGLARVKTMNAPELTLRSDLIGSVDGYNYRADLFNIPY
jgi:hypothetical protein